MAQASKTIAEGFSVIRRANDGRVGAVTSALDVKSEGHAGVQIYHPTSDYGDRAEVRLWIKGNIVRNSQLLGHLKRVQVYKTLEAEADLSTGLNLTTASPLPKDRVLANGAHPLGFTFDPESAAKIHANYDLIGRVLGQMAWSSGVRAGALEWPEITPDIILATAAPNTPDSILQGMHQVLEDYAGVEFRAAPIRILPRLERSRP